MVYAVWQAQDNSYWTSGPDGKTSVKAIVIAITWAYLFFFVPSYGIVRAWRNLPASRKMRFWFTAVSITVGILWCSFLFRQSVLAGQIYSLTQALLLVLFWSVIFLTGLLFVHSLRHFFRWLFSWRILKRGLMVLGLFAVLVALFYVEENWRGRHDWNEYRQALENNGEKLNLAAFAPPSVPDEQNFAMAPVLFTSYSNNLAHQMTDGEPADTSSSNRLEMNLDRTNLIYSTNRIIGSWQKTMLTDLRPWQDYYRARFITNEMMSEPPPMLARVVPVKLWNTNNIYYNVAEPLDTTEFPIAAHPQSPAADVLLALSRYQQMLDELQQAGERQYSRFPVNYTNDNRMEIFLPHLACLKSPALALQLRAIAELQAGQTEAALRDIKLMLRLADSLRSEPFLISQLVRIVIINLSLQPVWEGLAEQRWSDAELKILIGEFQKLDLVSDLEFALHGERAVMLGDIEYFKSHRSESASFLLMAILSIFFWGNWTS